MMVLRMLVMRMLVSRLSELIPASFMDLMSSATQHQLKLNCSGSSELKKQDWTVDSAVETVQAVMSAARVQDSRHSQ